MNGALANPPVTPQRILDHLYDNGIHDPQVVSGFLSAFGTDAGDIQHMREILVYLTSKDYVQVWPRDSHQNLGTLTYGDIKLGITPMGEQEVERRRGRRWRVPIWLKWFADMTNLTKGIALAAIAVAGFLGIRGCKNEKSPCGFEMKLTFNDHEGRPVRDTVRFTITSRDTTTFHGTAVGGSFSFSLCQTLHDVRMSATSGGLDTLYRSFERFDSATHQLELSFPGPRPKRTHYYLDCDGDNHGWIGRRIDHEQKGYVPDSSDKKPCPRDVELPWEKTTCVVPGSISCAFAGLKVTMHPGHLSTDPKAWRLTISSDDSLILQNLENKSIVSCYPSISDDWDLRSHQPVWVQSDGRWYKFFVIRELDPDGKCWSLKVMEGRPPACP